MCDNCGQDHPGIEEVAREILLLDRAWDMLREQEEHTEIPAWQISSNPLPVDYFATRVAEDTCQAFMVERVFQKRQSPPAATESYGVQMFLIGFALAMKTRGHWVELNPEMWSEQAPVPTEEEVSAWLEEQRAEAERLESEEMPSKEKILEALKAAGINIPAHVQIITGSDKEERKTGETETPGMYL